MLLGMNDEAEMGSASSVEAKKQNAPVLNGTTMELDSNHDGDCTCLCAIS